MGTWAYPLTLCVPTRPRSADASAGQVRLPPPDIASPVGISSGLFQTADAPGLTWPESPAATSTLPGEHRPSGRASNRLSCTLLSDHPTADAGIAGISQPAYLGQPIQLRPAAPTQLVSGYVRHPLAMDPSAGRPLRRSGIVLWSRWFAPHKDNQRARHPMLQSRAGRHDSCLKPRECGHRLDNQERINSTSQ